MVMPKNPTSTSLSNETHKMNHKNVNQAFGLIDILLFYGYTNPICEKRGDNRWLDLSKNAGFVNYR